MQEIIGDIFNYLNDKDTNAICIFTNGIVNSYGYAMAGAGQAGEASRRWLNFRTLLGTHINKNGNIVGVLGKVNNLSNYISDNGHINIISFPTKQHFNKPSIPKLIEQSSKELKTITDQKGFKKIILGRPGCGKHTGRLSWDKDVKKLIEPFLDDRFIITRQL